MAFSSSLPSEDGIFLHLASCGGGERRGNLGGRNELLADPNLLLLNLERPTLQNCGKYFLLSMDFQIQGKNIANLPCEYRHQHFKKQNKSNKIQIDHGGLSICPPKPQTLINGAVGW